MKRKLLFRLAAIFIPVLIAYAVELFILPVDFFTFRCWEALWADNRGYFNGAVFYPNMRLDRIETGDLVPYTPFAVKKQATWITDRYGCRKRETGKEDHDIVIIGDSMAVGTTLSQEDILSEVLERETGFSVYPYAPYRDVNQYLSESRFRVHRPRIVILETLERNIPDLPRLDIGRSKSPPAREKPLGAFAVRFLVLRDRFNKQLMYHYLKKRVFGFGRKPVGVSYPDHPSEIFLKGTAATITLPGDQIDNIAGRIAGYSEYFARQGIHFIFLPLPNKESIYYRQIPGGSRSLFLDSLIEKLKGTGIDVIDAYHPFESVFHEKGVRLFHSDDSHWTRQGVRLAADLIMSDFQSRGYSAKTNRQIEKQP